MNSINDIDREMNVDHIFNNTKENFQTKFNDKRR